MDLPHVMGMPEHGAAILWQRRSRTIASGHTQMLGNHFKRFLALNLLQADDVRIDLSIDRAQALQYFDIRCRRHIRREGNPLEPENVVTEDGELIHLLVLFPVRPTNSVYPERCEHSNLGGEGKALSSCIRDKTC